LLVLWLLLSVLSSDAQVLVYRIEVSEGKGINFHAFEGGFFAAPVLGGAGSFLLTSVAEGRTFTESANAGSLFTAVGGGKKKAVISATTGSGTAHGALVALGDIEQLLRVDSPTASLNVQVAKILTGETVSADDESSASAPASDGSIGSAGFAKIKFVLDEGQTNHANKGGLSLAQTVEQLKTELGREGYSAAAPVTPAAGTTTTGTTNTAPETSTAAP
jgi:hypothetical protein